jgi:hypothetical protein
MARDIFGGNSTAGIAYHNRTVTIDMGAGSLSHQSGVPRGPRKSKRATPPHFLLLPGWMLRSSLRTSIPQKHPLSAPRFFPLHLYYSEGSNRGHTVHFYCHDVVPRRGGGCRGV